MRITPGMIATQVTADLQQAAAALAAGEGSLTSGHRVSKPSDDPGAAAEIIAIQARQATGDEYERTINAARDQLSAADSTLRSVTNALTNAKELAVQGASDTNDAVARQSLATQVNQLLEQLVALGNGQGPRGAMLFGGQETTTAPYSVTRDVNGNITAVTVNPRGIDGTTSVQVGDGNTVSTGISGTAVFGAQSDPNFAFAALISLRDNLNADNGAAVGASLDQLSAVLDRATLASTTVGSQLGWLNTLEQRSQDGSVALAGSLSRLQDVDLISASEKLQQLQTAYQAALAASAHVLGLSLVDFLK